MSLSYTSNLKLQKPQLGDTGWSVPVLANYDTLDAIAPIGGLAVTLTETPSASLNVKVSPGNVIAQDGSVASYGGTTSQPITASVTRALYLDGPSSWALSVEVTAFSAAFRSAKDPNAQYLALARLFGHFVLEAQPQWDIVNHRGPVPLTAEGMLRLPLTLGLSIVGKWQATFNAAKKASSEPLSAVDALIPAGPLNQEVKRRLRAVKPAAEKKAA